MATFENAPIPTWAMKAWENMQVAKPGGTDVFKRTFPPEMRIPPEMQIPEAFKISSAGNRAMSGGASVDPTIASVLIGLSAIMGLAATGKAGYGLYKDKKSEKKSADDLAEIQDKLLRRFTEMSHYPREGFSPAPPSMEMSPRQGPLRPVPDYLPKLNPMPTWFNSGESRTGDAYDREAQSQGLVP